MLHRTRTETYVWMVRYIRYVTNVKSRITARLHERILESFFSLNRDKTKFSQIGVHEVLDYREARIRQGKTVRWVTHELDTIRQFLDFYIRVSGTPMHNPAAPRNLRRHKGNRFRLLLKHATRILNAARTPQERAFVQLLFHGLTGKEAWQVQTGDLKDGKLTVGVPGRAIAASTGLLQALGECGEGQALSGLCLSA